MFTFREFLLAETTDIKNSRFDVWEQSVISLMREMKLDIPSYGISLQADLTDAYENGATPEDFIQSISGS